MNSAKIFGWISLISGIVIIIFTLFSSYQIFTGQAAIPIIFKVGEKSENQSTSANKTIPEELQKELQGLIQQQLSQIIPTDLVTKTLNLVSWSILAGILIFGGGKISELGIRLVKQ